MTGLPGRIITFANQKGGVGKTTTAVNLGAYLADMGRRVLLVDSDPQGNATTSLGINPRELHVSIYDVLIDRVPVADAVTLTDRMGLELLPSSVDLAGVEVEMAGVMARENQLARILNPLRLQFDYILVDDPPSLGLLTINGLTATDGVVIPVQCEYLALEGLSLLMDTVGQVHEILNSRLQITGVLLTMYDARTRLSQQVVDEVRRYLPHLVFQTIIPRNVRLSEAPSHGQSILSYAPESAGAQAYQAFAREFVERVERIDGVERDLRQAAGRGKEGGDERRSEV